RATGFDVSTLSTLDVAPFTGSWQKITSISGAVVDIKTSGNKLYVLITQVSANKKNPMKSKLLSFAFDNTLAGMFGTSTVLAQTGVDIFADVSAFFGIQIIATGDVQGANPENKEQLILATNNGLFKSDADQTVANGIIDATDQTTANWTAVEANTMFPGIAGIDTPVRYTVWPFSVQDVCNFHSFARGSIHQLSGTGNVGGTAADIGQFVPTQFNANDTTQNFETLDPIVYFWSDGGRRLFIVKPITSPSYQSKISSLPFDVITWNSANTILQYQVLQTIQRFFWIKQIGATGLLLAGTERGIVGLE
ncbi:MAG: hypothetical protein Q8Q25_01300, partial [bacterium]|nr:hypothetical protein [bacterium]